MHLIATVVSTRKFGHYIDIVTDGTLFIGAYTTRYGGGDFLPGTGSNSLMETLAYIERALLKAPVGRTLPPSPRRPEEWEEKRAQYAQDGWENE